MASTAVLVGKVHQSTVDVVAPANYWSISKAQQILTVVLGKSEALQGHHRLRA